MNIGHKRSVYKDNCHEDILGDKYVIVIIIIACVPKTIREYLPKYEKYIIFFIIDDKNKILIIPLNEPIYNKTNYSRNNCS